MPLFSHAENYFIDHAPLRNAEIDFLTTPISGHAEIDFFTMHILAMLKLSF
jgi:hypothetical protein